MIKSLVSTLAVALGLAACARPIPPAGGPEDKVPPRLLKVMPESAAVLVSPTRPIEFEFSEWVDPRSASTSIQVTPAPQRTPTVEVDGRFVRLVLKEPLDSPATYVIRIGKGLSDFHQAASTEAVEIPFSTGKALDSNEIWGRVWKVDSTGIGLAPDVRVGVWPLDSTRRTGLGRLLQRKDSLQWLKSPPQPWRERSWRWTGLDSLGQFRLTHLPAGQWRIWTWIDRDKDGYWRPGVEDLAWLGDVDFLGSNRLDLGWGRLAFADTSGAVRVRDSAQRRDSSRLDSLDKIRLSLPDSAASFAVLDSDSLPPGWLGNPALRGRILSQVRKLRAVDILPGQVVRLSPGSWSGEIWLDRDQDGRPSSIMPASGRIQEPWFPAKTQNLVKGDTLRLIPLKLESR